MRTVSKLAEYYFDIETTGFNFDKDEIITIQWQKISGFTGKPISELKILKRWEYENEEKAEEEMINSFIPNLNCKPLDFIFIGKNLAFDFCILDRRMRHYGLGKFNLQCFYDKAILDIKPILVMINRGKFKGYNKIIPKTNPIENKEISKLYRQKKYDQIIQYIIDESKDFLRAYQTLKREIPKLKPFLNIKSPDG